MSPPSIRLTAEPGTPRAFGARRERVAGYARTRSSDRSQLRRRGVVLHGGPGHRERPASENSSPPGGPSSTVATATTPTSRPSAAMSRPSRQPGRRRSSTPRSGATPGTPPGSGCRSSRSRPRSTTASPRGRPGPASRSRPMPPWSTRSRPSPTGWSRSASTTDWPRSTTEGSTDELDFTDQIFCIGKACDDTEVTCQHPPKPEFPRSHHPDSPHRPVLRGGRGSDQAGHLDDGEHLGTDARHAR